MDGLGSGPRTLDKNLFDKRVRFLIMVIGTATSFLLFFLYYGLLKIGFDAELVRSFIFATFASYSLLLVFSLRSLEKSILSYNPFANFYLVGGVVFGLVLTAIAIYHPFLQKILGTVALPPLWVAGVIGMGVLSIIAVELGKWLYRRQILR